MNILDSHFRSDATRRCFPVSRAVQSSQLTRRPLTPARASTIAPGLRELRAWELPAGAVGRCQLAVGEMVTLTGISGQCWITLQGDRHDYLLVPGETLRFTGPGRLVFEAVRDEARLAVS